MYGRCETDPFDQATDVCDSCFGEFCPACLVTTKTRQHPICKACALIASGVRPGNKPLLRGSRKSADQRRQALREAPTSPAPFEYFDTVDDGAEADPGPSVADVETETEPVAAEERVETQADPVDEATGEVEPTESVETPVPTIDDQAADAPTADGDTTDSPTVAGTGPAVDEVHHEDGPSEDDEADHDRDNHDEDDEDATVFRRPRPFVEVRPSGPDGSRPADETADEPSADGSNADGVNADEPNETDDDRPAPLPRRGGGALPTRRRTDAPASVTTDRPGETAGAVATADRPSGALPRRRSKLAPEDRED